MCRRRMRSCTGCAEPCRSASAICGSSTASTAADAEVAGRPDSSRKLPSASRLMRTSAYNAWPDCSHGNSSTPCAALILATARLAVDVSEEGAGVSLPPHEVSSDRNIAPRNPAAQRVICYSFLLLQKECYMNDRRCLPCKLTGRARILSCLAYFPAASARSLSFLLGRLPLMPPVPAGSAAFGRCTSTGSNPATCSRGTLMLLALFNQLEMRFGVGADKADGDAGFAGPAGAANAVYVIY